MKRYFNRKINKEIDLDKEVCSLEQWRKDKGDAVCALSKNGYYIFVEPEYLDESDEYAIDDPYRVSDNINSDFHLRRFDATIDLLDRYTNRNDIRILDLGCGEGHLTEAIRLHNNDYQVYGLDYAISAIDFAVEKYPDIDFIVADAFEPPYEDNYFDVVVCNNIWEHVPDPLRMLDGISRVLKPGGLIVISTPSRYRLGNVLRIMCGIGTRFVSKLHVTEYSVGQVNEQLNYAGYSVLAAHSPSIREKNILVYFIKKIFEVAVKLVRSKHVLETTVFYAARQDER